MSDLEEAPARVVWTQGGDGMNARLHSLGDRSVVRRSVDVLSARALFVGASGGDEMT